MKDRVYILATIVAARNTKADIKRKWELYKIYQHNSHLNNFDCYLKWLADSHNLRMDMEAYEIAYFDNENTAISCAITFDNKSYPYLVVFSRALNTLHIDRESTKIHLFKFNDNTKTYHEVNIEDDILYLYIARHYDFSFYGHPKLKENANMYNELLED